MTGYLSIRRKPKMSGIQTVTTLYAAMLEAEKKAGPAEAIAASTRLLVDVLNEKRLSYDELVLAI
jgi:hypothetical protein